MKKLIGLTLALCLVLALAACSDAGGAASQAGSGGAAAGQSLENDPAAEALLEQATANLQNAESMRYSMLVDMEMEGAGQSAAVTVSTDAALQTDPLRMHAVMDMQMSGQSVAVETYAIQDGGELTVYTGMGGEWTERTAQVSGSADAFAQTGGSNGNEYLQGLQGLKTAGEETVDGVACTRVEGVLTGNSAQAALIQSGALDTFTQQGLDMGAVLEDVNIPLALWISVEGEELVRMEMDMAGTLDSIYNDLVAQKGAGGADASAVEFGVTKCTLTITYSAYNAVADITLPDGLGE